MTIKVKWLSETGKDDQVCATADVARSVMADLRKDPEVIIAMAYYDDDRGAFDTYMREIKQC